VQINRLAGGAPLLCSDARGVWCELHLGHTRRACLQTDQVRPLGSPRRDPRAPDRAESDLPWRESARRPVKEIDAGVQLFSTVFGHVHCARNFSIQPLILASLNWDVCGRQSSTLAPQKEANRVLIRQDTLSLLYIWIHVCGGVCFASACCKFIYAGVFMSVARQCGTITSQSSFKQRLHIYTYTFLKWNKYYQRCTSNF